MRVKGIGPHGGLAIVGPYPGYRENQTGIPFSGDTGDELERFLNGVDLPTRDDVYLTNLHKIFLGKDHVYTAEETRLAEPELRAELDRVNPSTIVTMGREVTRIFLGDVDVTDVEGIPWIDPNITTRVIFPLVHIAAGLRNPELSPFVVRGFQQLSSYLAGTLDARRMYDDPYPTPHYEEITSETALQKVLYRKAVSVLSVDSEGWPGKPWSLQFSTDNGTGYLIKSSHRDLLSEFDVIVHRDRPRVVFHSALHDIGIGREMGVKFDDLAFDDTMVMAYLLQLEPQGLKPGCLRHCSMKMSSYQDIVEDKANDLARDYLTWLWDSEQADYEERQHEAFAAEVAKGRRIKVLPKLPKTPLLRAVERVLSSKRPAELWKDQVLDLQVDGYLKLGACPEATLDYIDRDKAVSYGCRDADGTLRLHREYSKRIDAMGLREVYNLELATYPLLDRMQRIGIKPDLEQFAALSSALDIEIGRLRAELATVTNTPAFNANSGDQVAAYLFDTLGLEEIKFTSGGRGSTNDLILEALENEHPEYPQIALIRSYREFYKLKHTFVGRIHDYVNRWPFDGRVHTTLRTTRVVTGRLASADPNLLAQPEHGEWAEYFQRGWVADDGHTLCAWDESQIELRGLAHLSQDPVLLAVYRGELRNPDGSLIDLHANLAQRIFGGKASDYAEGTERLAAKAINFGLPMGMSAVGLSVQLRKNGVDADEETAQRWLDETFKGYPGVVRYMDERIAEASRCGYVRCLSGRIRYIGGIRSRNERVRAEAERFAFSTPIQESAQFVMKQAEVRVWNEVLPHFWKCGIWCEPLLQIHDCLKMEIAAGWEQELHQHMVDAMTNVPKGFCVPLAVVGKHGSTFADMQRFK